MSFPDEITILLQKWQSGDADAQEDLFRLVYKELRRIAQNRLNREGRLHALQATEVVHEIFPQLANQRQKWQNRSQFFALASECMRRFLVDHARTRQRQKRGGANAHQVSFADLKPTEICHIDNFDEILAVDRALEKLAGIDKTQALIIQHRYYGGLSREEIAELLGISNTAVDRSVRVAKAWLRRELAFQFSPYLLNTGQVRKPEKFIAQFRIESGNNFALGLRSVLPAELIRKIDQNRDEYDFLPSLIEALNKALLGTPPVTPTNGNDFVTDHEPQLSIENAVRLNRQLLEKAFPDEIIKVL